MSRLSIEDILKPGTKPRVSKLTKAESKRLQREVDAAYFRYLRLKRWDPELMNQMITI